MINHHLRSFAGKSVKAIAMLAASFAFAGPASASPYTVTWNLAAADASLAHPIPHNYQPSP